jgi:hypothetical protein
MRRPQDKFDVIVSAHRVLRRFIAPALSDLDITELKGDLRKLAASLPTHFDFEEQTNGFVAQIRQRHGDSAADQLIAEHREFLRTVHELLDPTASDDIRERIRQLATDLRQHELRERLLGDPAH